MTKYEFLEKLRKDLGYSRKKIADYLEVSASAIEKYEKGKLDFNHKTKYILGICALAGYNNEIFMIDSDIDEELSYEYKLTKFSSKIREIFYFLNLDYDEYELFLIKILQHNFKTNFILDTDYLLKIIDLKDRIINQNYYEQMDVINFIKNSEKFIKNVKKNIKNEFKKEENDIIYSIKKSMDRDKINFLANIRIEILILYVLKIFNPKEFYEKEKLPFFTNSLINFNSFIKNFNNIAPIGIVPIYNFDEEKEYLKMIFPNLKQTLEELIIKGKPVNKETIKEFKIELESGTLFANCNTPTDPKDKQICELLQYAPPTFKDKIIEKLLQYKKDVEEF